MKFSKSFIDKYANNTEMQNIILEANKHLEGAQINDFDKETIYEFLYGYQQAIAIPQGFDMETIYQKLDYLNDIRYEPLTRQGVVCGGVFENFNSGNEERPAYIVINSAILSSEEFAMNRKEALIHELTHLIDENFNSSSRGIIAGTSANSEIVTQDATIKIMDSLGYDFPTYVAELKINGTIEDAYVMSPSPAYAEIVGMAEYMKGIYGEKAILAAQFDGKELPTTYADERTMATITIKTYMEFKDNINSKVEAVITNPSFETYKDMQATFLSVLDKNLDNPNLNLSLESYMRTMQAVCDKSMFFVTNDQEFNSAMVQSTSFDIKNIYAQIHSLSSKELDTELNPMTRSQDCQNFLIAINGLKSLDISLTTEDILNMKYMQTITNGAPSIAVEAGNQTVVVEGSIDPKTGFVIIDDAQKTNEKFREIIHTEWGKSSYEYLSLSQSLDPEFNKTITAINLSSFQKDDYGNNFMHSIANSSSPTSNYFLSEYASLRPDAAAVLLVSKNDEGVTPIDMAVNSGNESFFKTIRESEIHLPVEHTTENPFPQQLFTQLEIASGMYDGIVRTEELKELLTDGEDILREGITGESPFGYAARTENVDFFIAAASVGFDREDLLIDELPFSESTIEKIEDAIREYDNDFAFE